MATVYDMCAVTEVIYCDIKNINGQYNVEYYEIKITSKSFAQKFELK
jgi:hypothetical protein